MRGERSDSSRIWRVKACLIHTNSITTDDIILLFLCVCAVCDVYYLKPTPEVCFPSKASCAHTASVLD